MAILTIIQYTQIKRKPTMVNKGQNFEKSHNLLNWNALGQSKLAKIATIRSNKLSNKKRNKGKRRIKNIRVLGQFEDDSFHTHTESKTETNLGRLTVLQHSNSTISKVSSQNSRNSFKGYNDKLLVETKVKRHSYLPKKTKFDTDF